MYAYVKARVDDVSMELADLRLLGSLIGTLKHLLKMDSDLDFYSHMKTITKSAYYHLKNI